MESNHIEPEIISNILSEVKQGKMPIPYKIQLNPQGYCNHNCTFCAYRNAGFEKEGMNYLKDDWVKDGREKVVEGKSGLSKQVSQEICEDINELGIKETEITGNGEPMCHPHIYKIFEILNEGNSKITLVTNGTNLKQVIPFITKNWSWIRVSINAGTAQTYQNIHQTNNINSFNKVMNDLKYVKETIKIPIYVSFCVVPENYKEIVLMTQKVKKMGLDGIKFNAVYTIEKDGMFNDNQAKVVQDMINKAKKLETDDFKVMDSFWKREKYNSNGEFDKCSFQYFVVNISYDGKVYPCCITTTRDQYAYGDLNKARFKDIIQSEQRKTKADTYNQKNCPDCWLKDFNIDHKIE